MAGVTADITLAETDTFVFTCRCVEVGRPVIHAVKRDVHVAAHIPERTKQVVELLNHHFDVFLPIESILHTGLGNLGLIFHPLPILMNITRVEAKEDFKFYVEGISPLVADVLERLDEERLSVAEAVGVSIPSARQWLAGNYGSQGKTLYEAIQNTKAYHTVLAPTDIDTRYIFEDIQTGCVPVVTLGRLVGVQTPIMSSAIDWASILYKRDFRMSGRNEHNVDFSAILKLANR